MIADLNHCIQKTSKWTNKKKKRDGIKILAKAYAEFKQYIEKDENTTNYKIILIHFVQKQNLLFVSIMFVFIINVLLA